MAAPDPGARTDPAVEQTLRVPPDCATRYPADARAGRALSLPRGLAMALEARGGVLARAQPP